MKTLGIFILTIFVSLMVQVPVSLANELNFNELTSSTKISDSLSMLSKFNTETILILKGQNRSQKPIRIMFKNLSIISPEYSDCEAISVSNAEGRRFILINSEHKDAPAEAIAALISHEAIHQDNISSIMEETQAWTNEAKSWIALKELNPEIAQINNELVKRMNKLESLYIKADYSSTLIQDCVASNTVYKSLAMHSPGF